MHVDGGFLGGPLVLLNSINKLSTSHADVAAFCTRALPFVNDVVLFEKTNRWFERARE